MSVDKLEEVTRALYEKGLERGQSEAAKILEAATLKAEKVLDEAEQKAKSIVVKAGKEAEQLKNAVSADIQTQFQYALDRISNRLALHITEESLPHAHNPEHWVATLLDVLVTHSLNKENQVNDFTLALPQDWESQFSASLQDKIKALVKQGISLATSDEDAFQITLMNDQEGFRIQLDPQELKQFITDRLSPLTKKLLDIDYARD